MVCELSTNAEPGGGVQEDAYIRELPEPISEVQVGTLGHRLPAAVSCFHSKPTASAIVTSNVTPVPDGLVEVVDMSDGTVMVGGVVSVV